MATASVDREACQGYPQCVLAAPSVFELDDEGLALAAERTLTSEEIVAVRNAELVCPVRAAKLVQ